MNNAFDTPHLSFAAGDAATLAAMPGLPAYPAFDDALLDFLQDLSASLLRTAAGHPDVATFAFWCRRAAMAKRKARYQDGSLRLGRGVVFHSTPSNVPVNFAFSFAAGLLSGNANIVRLPAKPFPQVDIICQAVAALLRTEAHAHLAPYVALVRYASSRELNDAFSALCDVRVVWGGDETIRRMRQSPLPPRATELTFANRFSIAVIQADSYLAAPNKPKIAQDFYNDTYLSDQNACTAPRIVVWLGERKSEAQHAFWDALGSLARSQYQLSPVQAVGKRAALCKLAAHRHVHLAPEPDQTVVRVALESLDASLLAHMCHSGYFLEYDAQALDEILPLCVSQCQTLTYLGLAPADIEAFLLRHRPRGIDRAVPMGQSMDFSLVWDGFDLVHSLTRVVAVR